MNTVLVDLDGTPTEVRVGDSVCYKMDYEKCGKVTHIQTGSIKVNGLWMNPDRCWLEYDPREEG